MRKLGRRDNQTVDAKQPDPSKLLFTKPIVNRAVRIEHHGETLLLYVPIRRRWWMSGPLGWLLPFRRERGIALDLLGRQVWEACDGHQTLERIIEQFAVRHRLRFHEARVSVMQFVRSLVERDLLVLALPEQAEAS
jgi:hypothetical protein